LWISLAMLFAGLLLAEALVRAVGPPVLPMPEAQGNLFADVKDPVLRYVHLPNARKSIGYDDGEGGSWTVHMETNGQRFRGPEVAAPKPEGVLRVACLGDSHTWGDGVSDDETWPAQLQGHAAPGVEIMNCGVNGYDTLQEVLWYERFVEPLDPDLVLLCYFANDVAARGLQETEALPRNDLLSSWTHPKRPGLVRSLRDISVTADLLCDRIWRWRSLRTRQDSWDSRYVPTDPGWQRARGALVRLRDRCLRDGRELRVVFFPYLVKEGAAFESSEVLRIAREFCQVNAIRSFDGEPALLAALGDRDTAELRVSLSDFHANGEAYGAFADAVAAWLAGDGLPFGDS
jgi:lysophospholipase L1-like esterase